MKEVFIVSAKRTPIGGFMGSLAGFSASELGAAAIRAAYEHVGLLPTDIESVYMGNVLTAGVGQSPARQASRFAGIADAADCTTVGKVCAAGMKAVISGAQQIQLGLEHTVITGGMESMSNAPHYVSLRKPVKLGPVAFTDAILKDGLTDAYNQLHMGNAAEKCVRKFQLTREQQDAYAIESYRRAVAATQSGKFRNEIVGVSVNQKSGTLMITEDEDIYKLVPEKIGTLEPAFESGGTITAANASNLNDAGAAILLVSEEMLREKGLKPLARIVSYADAAQEPDWFTTSPALAIPKALARAKMTLDQMDLFEINEAYAAVVLANQQLLNLDPAKINPYGGAVAMGHPIGASGARIICTLVSALQQERKKYGVAAICNGGGGASAIVLENLTR